MANVYGTDLGETINATDGVTNGADTIFGFGGNDTIFGLGGNDEIKGGGGADVLNGGSGIDTAAYNESSVGVTVLLYTDTAAYGDAEDDDLNSIENLTGSAHGDTLWGDDGVNVIKGMDGNDSLKGFGGADNLQGGDGNDSLLGMDGVDTLQGGNNNDTLDGGAEADTMIGGIGNDIFIVDNAGDTVIEASFEGNDTVRASVNYQLAAGVWVETLRTTEDAATTAINLTGNGAANSIFGNAGANTLDGKGNADTMQGLAGDDTYFVNNAGDIVIDTAGNGADTVIATASYSLQAGLEIELLRTMGSATNYAANFTGNEIAQSVHGNAAANTLNGGGGADAMIGADGDDTYYVDNAFDVVTEVNAQGTDRVIATKSYVLGAGTSVETLRTTGSASIYLVNLVGNELANTVAGNAAANLLLGKAGSDTLIGAGGNDTFYFDTALGASNVDTIVDYNVAQDTIQLNDTIFGGLPIGALAASAFHVGAAATEDEHRIIYNSATGALIFDSNGNVVGGTTQFATLAAGLALTNADFVVV